MTFLSIEELKEFLPDPKWTVKELDRYIIGQEAAKKTLALLMLNRALIMCRSEKKIDMSMDIPKYNALLIGPSGVGKTGLIRALSKVFKIPITIFDVTSVTSNGYVGADVEDILHAHIENQHEYWVDYITSGDNVLGEKLSPNQAINEHTKSEILQNCIHHGIIYLDEIDKISARETNGLDICGDQVQNALLQYLEGGTVRIDFNSSHRKNKSNVANISAIDTTNIFFIAGGAFSGIEDIIANRLKDDTGIGFTSNVAQKNEKFKDRIMSKVTSKDIINYGFKKEFVGRIPLITSLKDLEVEDLMKIMIEPANAIIKQYQEIFKVLGVELTVEEEGYREIAQYTLDLKMGARALKPTFNKLLEQDLFNIFDRTEDKLVITKEDVKKRLG